MGKEMLDLLHDDIGQMLFFIDIGIIGESRIDGHRQQLFVATGFVLELQHCNRPHANDATGHER